MASKKKGRATIDEERDDRDKVDAAEFWQEHYRTGEPPWDHGEPSPPLVSLGASGALPKGRLCVLGCGWGHDAVHFAKAGWEVTAVDFTAGAIEGARARAAKAGVALRLEQEDVFRLPRLHRAEFDLLLEHTCFCAIRPERRGEYLQMARWILKRGGTLFGVFYNHGGKGGPPWTVSEREVRALFDPSFDILRLETARNSFENRAGKELLAVFRLRSPLP